ncbi:hypothetical protein CEW46_21445 [Bacillus cereus]|nr:hypothetical protein CEW46_21445 [Bacillus cereus]
MKYVKKPVVIEAFRYGVDDRPDWFDDAVTDNTVITHTSGTSGPFDNPDRIWCTINTLEGKMTANEGDYIIKGVKGELYPCRADIFHATYEIVKENYDE